MGSAGGGEENSNPSFPAVCTNSNPSSGRSLYVRASVHLEPLGCFQVRRGGVASRGTTGQNRSRFPDGAHTAPTVIRRRRKLAERAHTCTHTTTQCGDGPAISGFKVKSPSLSRDPPLREGEAKSNDKEYLRVRGARPTEDPLASSDIMVAGYGTVRRGISAPSDTCTFRFGVGMCQQDAAANGNFSTFLPGPLRKLDLQPAKDLRRHPRKKNNAVTPTLSGRIRLLKLLRFSPEDLSHNSRPEDLSHNSHPEEFGPIPLRLLM